MLTFSSRGPIAFNVFHHALEHHYPWLSDEINQLKGYYDSRLKGVSLGDEIDHEVEVNEEVDFYGGPPLSSLTVTRKEKV